MTCKNENSLTEPGGEIISDNFIEQKNQPAIDQTSDNSAKDNGLQDKLSSIGLKQADIDFILEQGEKFMTKPALLAKKFKISENTAKMALEALKLSKQEHISKEDINKIEICLAENPEFESPEDIAFLCNINETMVAAYFESRPLNDSKKSAIHEKFNAGNSIDDIAKLLIISNRKVQEYVENTFITFNGTEGQKIWEVIHKNFPEIQFCKLREMILSRNLKLQDQLCCILHQRNEKQFLELKNYLEKFEESRSFFKVNLQLTMNEISYIKQSSVDDIEQLCLKLNKVETVIRKYLEQYDPNDVEKTYLIDLQSQQIQQVMGNFANITLTFQTYRMIIADSFESMIKNTSRQGLTPTDVFNEILPLAFYYLKCSLPLEDITQIIANSSKITLTAHEVFHIIFQLSDPVLRGFCIEHYSFNNPVPFYYPKIQTMATLSDKTKFGISKELWYSLKQFNGLVSFGLGRASWNPIGKSFLLDLIFESDFVKTNPHNSAFHFSSIDIQMTKNLFGEMKEKSSEESTKWAYIDCHGHSNLDIIRVICQNIDIALIHISESDFKGNSERWNQDIDKIAKGVKHIFIFIRDCKIDEVKLQVEQSKTLIFVPNLTNKEINIHSVRTSLKEIGYKILHLTCEDSKLIGDEFLQSLIAVIDPQNLNEIQSNKQLILDIISHINKSSISSSTLNFSFLNYYPIFVDYMSCYYQAAYANDQNNNNIDELNTKCRELEMQLQTSQMGQIVTHFNEIIKRPNSTLVLWKLSEELSLLSNSRISEIKRAKQGEIIEQKNDKYTLEILWREAILSYKYCANKGSLDQKEYKEYFALNFCNFVERGEAFELIDGDNLRFFNKDIDALLSKLYEKEGLRLDKIIQETNNSKIKQAPIVVSIFGPQSSGKSTLLNYCFGCKFLTSAGRCTRGIYGSFSRLSRPVKNSDNFLILDTEGLDAIERGNIKDTSSIHFDRTMVLFCLAVSQVVIINVKGDIGSEMQNLLQICAYSLNKLKVSKAAAPKIFFVLNQQADPDSSKHLDAINIMMEKLNKDSEILDKDESKISDLIQVSRENLFVLPSAFNSEQMNKPTAKLFNSKVSKLSPTITFADKCADLRLGIIKQLDSMPDEHGAPFGSMSEWMEMSGVIWDTIIKYQDIVKYRNVEEMKCNNLLSKMVSELFKNHISNNGKKFDGIVEKLFNKIKDINSLCKPSTILEEKMLVFDEVFTSYKDKCLEEYTNECKNDVLIKKMNHISEESKTNLTRLIYMERHKYSDRLKFQIMASLTEVKLSDSMKKFQELIVKNVDTYLELSIEQQKSAFENTWSECYQDNEQQEELDERNETFEHLYSLFKIESNTMEHKSEIFEFYKNMNFDMNKIIKTLQEEILTRFKSDPTTLDGKEQYIFPCQETNRVIKEMIPYGREQKYHFMGNESLYVIEKGWFTKEKPKIHNWIPEKCHPQIKLCSGYYSHPDITWELDARKQILILASLLKDPDNDKRSTWNKFIDDLSSQIHEYVRSDPDISQGTVKQIINILCSQYKLVNHEIGFIQAKLSNIAERTISTFAFTYAFKSLWETKSKIRNDNKLKTRTEKYKLVDYFLQKIKNRKMVRGTRDRRTMKESDQKMSQKFAKDFLEGVRRRLKTGQQRIIEEQIIMEKDILSHKIISNSAHDTVSQELNRNAKTDINFVVEYICDRNKLILNLFENRWKLIEKRIYDNTAYTLKDKLNTQIKAMKNVLTGLLKELKEKNPTSGSSEHKAFDSECNFEIVNFEGSAQNYLEVKMRESPFKAMTLYIEKYLDPTVSPENFNAFFKDTFTIEGVQIKISDTYVLCNKPIIPTDADFIEIFKNLKNTMFHSENIFNIHEYISGFLSVLDNYKHELSIEEFREMIKSSKEKYKTDAIGCPNRCPSCGKNCERELHPNDGICQIKTGHQLCSMGGWFFDKCKDSILVSCDDYPENKGIIAGKQTITWAKYKEIHGKDWNWSLPTESDYKTKQQNNRERMKNIWNKFGREILNYYAARGVQINYVPYISYDEVLKTI